MSRLKLVLGILAFLIVAQGVAIVLLGLLLYQATPNSVLARDTFIGRIPGLLATVRVVDRMGNILYWGQGPPEPLPHYALAIAPEDLKKIEDALPTELPSQWYGNLFLTDDAKVWVPATLTADSEEYSVEVRVRGDIFNHWAYRKKSWRVRFDKNNLFRGMRELNLLIPEDREWFAEPLNAYRAQKLGLLHPPIRFVTVSINGSGPLLYTEVEHWTKEMLEKLGRPGDTDIFGAGGGTSRFQQWDPVLEHVEYWDKYQSDRWSLDSYEAVEELNRLARDGAHRERDYVGKIEALFDVDKLVEWYVLSLLAGSRHVSDFNLRLFVDPTTGKLEPLPWDISVYAPRPLVVESNNALLREVFRVPALKLSAYKMLWEYVNSEAQVTDDLKFVSDARRRIERAAYRDSLKLQSNRKVRSDLDRIEGLVGRNMEYLKAELETCEVLVSERLPMEEQQSRGHVLTIDITARGVAPASLKEVKLPAGLRSLAERGAVELWRDGGDGTVSRDDQRVLLRLREEPDAQGRAVLETNDETLSLLPTGEPEPQPENLPRPAHTRHRFFVVLLSGELPDDALPLKLDIRNAVTGAKADIVREILIDERTFERISEISATKLEFLRRYPFFSAGVGPEVILRGSHTILETVIVPSTVTLTIAPGTELRMAEGVSIFSYAPVTMVGSTKNPIRVSALDPDAPWGVFAVLDAEGQSTVEWVNMSDGSEATVNGARVTGMLAFHGSPVTIADSVFTEAHGDDAVNLKDVYVDIKRAHFSDNDFDALDIDNALSGTVETSVFKDNGNDGLDISWSPIIIRNVTMEGNGDKCLSVGERSTPLIYDSTLKRCPYGIAVKDDSHAKLERVRFSENAVAVGAYIKKPIFSPPSVVVNESTFENNQVNTRALSGAVITVDSAN